MQRAAPGHAFVNDEAFEAWMEIWCSECNVDECPLITAGAMGYTPAAWVLRDAGAVNKYVCTEFERRNADDPTVVIEGGQAPTL
jgi:hypothetical protein